MRAEQPWPKPIWPSPAEWGKALRPAYWTFTALVALTLAGSFVSYQRVVSSGHPWLPRKQCSGCAFCGMTRSFCALSAGRPAEAVDWNPGGPLLYGAGWLWLGLVGVGIARRGRGDRASRRRKESEPAPGASRVARPPSLR